MKTMLSLCLGLNLFATVAWAQESPPVSESYFAKLSITHEDDLNAPKIAIDILYNKIGGRADAERQFYLYMYLKDNEAEIMKLADSPELLDAPDLDKKLLVDTLIRRKLVIELDSKVAKPLGELDEKGQSISKYGNYPYQFSFSNDQLFQTASLFEGFESKNNSQGSFYYPNRIKILAFVPHNNSKYATKISAYLTREWDVGAGGNKVPMVFFKPLPYEFRFATHNDRKIYVYVN